MAVLTDLIARELLFLIVLAALGAGPAAFVSDRFDRCARTAMAPVLGLCLGACLTVTLVYWFPARGTGWLVVLVAVLSIGAAVWRRPSIRRAPSTRGVLELSIVVVVILVSFSYPLVVRETVGPVGGYQISDTSGYVSETNGEQRQSLRHAERLKPPYSDLTVAAWSVYGKGVQQLDISALESNYNQVLGLGATDTQSAVLIAVLAAGGLGAFAVVRRARRAPTWGAVAAGCLFAGPMFVQLFMEGSQAAIAGSAVLAPIVSLGWEAIRRRSVANLVLLGLAAAGLQTMYPLFVPCVAIGGAIVLGGLLIRAVYRRSLTAGELLRHALALGLVLALAVILTPVAFSRNARYWAHLLKGTFSFAGLPAYVLPANAVPGWLLQTRDFYGLANLSQATLGQLLLGAVVPLMLLAIIGVGIWRKRTARVLLVVAIAASLLAYYTWTSEGCSYCVQRNLIPVGVLAVAGIGMGFAAIAALRWRAAVWAAALAALVAVVAIGHEGAALRQRLTHSDYMLDQDDRDAVAALPPDPGPVELEGFTESSQAPAELPLVYNLLEERIRDDVSLPTTVSDNSGLAYLIGGPAPLGPSFKANYQYVLTRLAGVATQRRTVARFGPVALQRRIRPLDITAISGLSVATERLDPAGTAWVSPGQPLQFLIVGDQHGAPAWVSLRLRATVAIKVASGSSVVSQSQSGGQVAICLRASGNPPVRAAAVQLQFTPQPPPAPPNGYDQPLPARGLRLTSMAVSTRPCAAP